MVVKYKIIPDLQNKNSLIINPSAEINGMNLHRKIWFLRFGLQAVEIKVKTSNRIREDEIKLTLDLIEGLNIPLSGSYEIRIPENEIILGPYIGFLVSSEQAYLDRSVQYLTSHLKEYAQIGGAIVAFSLESIDAIQQTITGYMFNPERNTWEPGVYAYPAAVFKTIYLKKEWRSFFQTLLGNRLFNSYIFSKWEMFKWLRKVPEVKEYLPDTILYKGLQDLEHFLQLHEQIYVKPLNGSHGVGIYKITRLKEEGFKVETELEGAHQEYVLASLVELAEFLRSQLKQKSYMLQQAINLISVAGRKIDFRIVLTKDQAGVWQDMIMVAKYGRQGSTVTNIKSGGSAEVGEVTLKKVFNLTDDEVLEWRREILEVAFNAAESLEQIGVHCGNLGVDIAIDQDKKIWIIEMNNLNPDPLIALDVNNREIFYKIKHMNMLYAKRLAGFPKER